MTARCKKRRNQNNAIRRVKNKVKEVKKLKKMLGFIEEDVGEGSLMDKLKDITEQKKKEQEQEIIKKEAMQELIEKERNKIVKKKDKTITVVNPKTNVTHRYNVKTKRDQFGQFPVWHNPRSERKKYIVRKNKGGKRKPFHGKRLHYVNRTSNWALLA
uniref:Uncharacterized protein n=1 Tax=Anopheles christyi TaxID=43041 RepID=A0A182K9V5_9DIPT